MDPITMTIAFAAMAVAASKLFGKQTAAPASKTYNVPTELDRGDFARPEARCLVAVFTALSCDACAGVWEQARHMDSDEVVVHKLAYEDDEAIFDRYEIDNVPTLLVVDADGDVRYVFLGSIPESDLDAAVADCKASML